MKRLFIVIMFGKQPKISKIKIKIKSKVLFNFNKKNHDWRLFNILLYSIDYYLTALFGSWFQERLAFLKIYILKLLCNWCQFALGFRNTASVNKDSLDHKVLVGHIFDSIHLQAGVFLEYILQSTGASSKTK